MQQFQVIGTRWTVIENYNRKMVAVPVFQSRKMVAVPIYIFIFSLELERIPT
jgi:hypothetical protein